MRQTTALFLLSTLATAAFGQSDTGITATVSRTVVLAPNEARFSATLTTPAAMTFEEAFQRVAGVGLQESELTGQDTSSVYDPATSTYSLQNRYFFTFVRPASALRSLTQQFEALRTKLTGVGLEFGATLGSSASALDEARRTLLPQLMEEAKRKAESLAAAAGLSLGALQTVADFDYAALNYGYPDFRFNYSLTVRFALK